VLGTKDGKPTISVADPSIDIDLGRVNIDGHGLGVIGGLMNLLLPLFQSEVHNLVERELKTVVENVVENDLQGLLDKTDFRLPLPVPPPFDNSLLQFDLTSITAHADHATVDCVMGIFDSETDRLVRRPVRSVIPDIFDSSRMMSLSIAPEILEDIVHFHGGKFKQTLKHDELKTGSFIGTLLTTPPLAELWGQKDMQVTFSLDGDPEFKFREGTMEVSLGSALQCDVEGVGDKKEPEHAFTLSAPFMANSTAKIRAEPEQAFVIELQSMSLTPLSTKWKHDRIDTVNTAAFNPLVKLMEERLIMPEINKLLDGGLACCGSASEFALRKMAIRLAAGAFVVFADVDVDLRAILR